MGCYINPADETKEEFLEREGTPLLVAPATIDGAEGALPVCLVFNPYFTAAGVMYSDRELRDFTDSADRRPKLWYSVPTEALRAVSPIEEYLSSVA